MDNVYLCVAHLGRYDKYDSPDRQLVESAFQPFVVMAQSEAEALAHVKEHYAYNKQYFEYVKGTIVEIDATAVSMLLRSIIRPYKDVLRGESYRLISPDVFVKGEEGWEGSPDWLVVVKGK